MILPLWLVTALWRGLQEQPRSRSKGKKIKYSGPTISREEACCIFCYKKFKKENIKLCTEIIATIEETGFRYKKNSLELEVANLWVSRFVQDVYTEEIDSDNNKSYIVTKISANIKTQV